MYLVEFDLAGADWVVTAYLANDERMIEVANSDKSPHALTGALMTDLTTELVEQEYSLVGMASDPSTIADLRRQLPEVEQKATFLPRSMSIRQGGKKSNHGLNYGMMYRRFALENEMPETDAKPLVEKYHQVYPGLRANYYEDIKRELRENDRTLENLLGRKVRLLDQAGPDLWNKAYSFKPQSTVFDVCRVAIRRAYDSDDPILAPMQLLAQVHDSVLTQYPEKPWDRLLEFIEKFKELLSVPLVAHGREFTLGVDAKLGRDWGHMEPLDAWSEDSAGTEDAAPPEHVAH